MTAQTRYVYVGETSEIAPAMVKVVEGLDRVPTCILNLDGQFYGFSGVCSHKGGLLWEGALNRGFVVCPTHRAQMRVRDGRYTWPGVRNIRTFPVKVEGTSLYLEVPASKGGAAVKTIGLHHLSTLVGKEQGETDE